MYIKDDLEFHDLKDRCWAGAVDTLEKIEELGLEEALIQLLEDIFCEEIPSITEVNDLLRFEDEWIFETLGINEEEEE